MTTGSLESHLSYEPVPLAFGTSGRRGQVVHLTQLEVYLNVQGELEYLQSLPPSAGGIARGDEFYFAYDLRPSSTQFVPEAGGRGELAQAVAQAVRDTGLCPVNLGAMPTPALACHSLARGRGSIMITGSHIPFDRNGYKTYSAQGELRKTDEAPVGRCVDAVRQRLYAQSFETSPFDERGMFKHGHADLPAPSDAARAHYLARYLRFFGEDALRGLRLLAYQHSAVGRDLLVDLLRRLGADVLPAGRSDAFVPIDTENIDAARLAAIQALVDGAGPVDAVVSTDGDSDRPLLLSVDAGRARFFGGDLVGMIVAEFLGADAVVVPISCNDAVDRGRLAAALEPKTRIGSPYVIAGMEAAKARGRRAVCGWEANGGFLTGTDIARNGRTLAALPTRDAVLPILCVLTAMKESGAGMTDLFARLPRRFSAAALLREFPRTAGRRLVETFSGPEAAAALGTVFSPARGFPAIDRVDFTDGIRLYFAGGDIAHVRPSGNADELRIYAVADSQDRADAIVRLGVEGPDCLLRQMEKLL